MATRIPLKSKVLLLLLFIIFAAAIIVPYNYISISLKDDIKKNELSYSRDIERLNIFLDMAKIKEYEYIISEKKVDIENYSKARWLLKEKVLDYLKLENEEIFRRFRTTTEIFEQYQRNLNTVGIKGSGLIEKMRSYAHAVEKEVQNNRSATVAILMMRRLEKNYILRRDLSDTFEIEKIGHKLLNDDSVTKRAKENVNLYLSTLSEIKRLIEENKLLIQIYRNETEQLSSLMSFYVKNIEKMKTNISQRQEDFLVNYMILGLLAGLLLIIILIYILNMMKQDNAHKDELLIELNNKIDEKNRLQDELVSQEKLAGLGGLAAGIAHEIKNPLNLITNSAKIITELCKECTEEKDEIKKTEYFKDATPMLMKSAEIIDNNIIRANDIIKNILALARGTKDKNFELHNLRNIVYENYTLSFHAMRATSPIQVEFINEMDDVGDYECLKTDLSRALINIFDNSFYSLGQKLKNKQYAPYIHVKLYRKDFKRILKIRDNGEGISRENLMKVQEPFFTTKPVGEGTGLGLSFVSDVIKAHSAMISIESKLNEYTEITIEF